MYPVRLHNGSPCRECKRGDSRYCYGGASQTTSRGGGSGGLAQTYTSRKEELNQLEEAVKEQQRRDYEATLASGLFVEKKATLKERIFGWFGYGTPVPQPPARVIRPEVGVEPQVNAVAFGGGAGAGGAFGGGGAFGSGSFGHPVNAAVSGTSQSAVWQPTEFSVWRMIEAMDGKPLAAACFGAQRSGKTQTTGALLHSLQAIMGFENLLYGLGANSSYDSPDNVTLRQFVHNDQVTVISCPADIGNLIDRAVSTNEKKVLVLDDIMHVLEGNATKKIGILCSMGRKSRTSFVGIFHANIGGRQKAVVLNGLTIIVVCGPMVSLLEQRELIPKDQVELVRGWMKQITKEQKLLFLPSSVEIKTAFWLRGSEMQQQFLVEPKIDHASAAATMNALMDVSSDDALDGPAPARKTVAPGKARARKTVADRYAGLSTSDSSSDSEDEMPPKPKPTPKPKPKPKPKRKEDPFDLEKEFTPIVGMEKLKEKLRA